MNAKTRWSLIVLLSLLAAGCGSTADMASVDREGQTPAGDRQIEESDIYKLDGDWLYIQNPATGLNVINVADPDHPSAPLRLEVTGEAGELYVRDGRAFILFKRASYDRCGVPAGMDEWNYAGTSEIVAAVSLTTSPKPAGRFCLPGTMVASRIVGDILYVITTNDDLYTSGWNTWIFALNIADPEHIHLADFIDDLGGISHEVHVTTRAVYIAQADMSTYTTVRYIDISDPEGVMEERGRITVQGYPQGRFHMDAYENMFRIVTSAGLWDGTYLHVIDFSDPDRPQALGSISGLAPGEELWATRFDGDRAYIVTYERQWLNTDPLWVISLEDPSHPEVLGELIVPGWSNFIFPRGDRLVAVGRGDEGSRVAVSLYDVSDPTTPAELERIELGSDSAVSEANTDYRGVSIVEAGVLGDRPMVTVPFSTDEWSDGDCTLEHRLQIIDLLSSDLTARGSFLQEGKIRRTVPIGHRLYSISDLEVAAIDVSNRSDPTAAAAVTVGGSQPRESCMVDLSWRFDRYFFDFNCSVSPADPASAAPSPALLLVLAAALLAVAIRRSRRP
jgi:MYXO-CTERM domain-containing protein